MQIVLEYISSSYMTLMLLVGLIVILIANRRTKIEGVQYVWTITGLVFALTICEYLEVWCDTYHKPVWILYLKAALSYTIHPLLILLELHLVAPIKHKFLLFLPFLADFALIISDLFGTNLIYGYRPDHSFIAGELHFFPALIVCFYILVLMKYSLDFLQNQEYSKAMIVIFMALSTIVTVYLEFDGIIVKHTTEIAALEMLVYYFYLAAIHHSEVQAELYKQKIELEQSKNALLMAQIQPHFINNSLMALRSRCSDYPEIYESITNFSRYLRSNFEALSDTRLVRFEQEMDSIEAYLALEMQNFGERLRIEYDIECDDFLIPALSVQPLVENAVRHGVGTYDKGGVVHINAHRANGKVVIEVIDDGSGRSSITEHQERRKGIGIENVRARLHSMSDGELEIITGEHGTTARIIIADKKGMVENHDNTIR